MKHSDEQTQFRVVALVGSDSAATRNTLEALYGVDGVEIAAAPGGYRFRRGSLDATVRLIETFKGHGGR